MDKVGCPMLWTWQAHKYVACFGVGPEDSLPYTGRWTTAKMPDDVSNISLDLGPVFTNIFALQVIDLIKSSLKCFSSTKLKHFH